MLSHSPPFKQSSLVFPFRASSASGLVLGTRNIWVYFRILSIFVNSCFCFVHRGNSNLREHKISFFVVAEWRSKREPLVPNDPRGRKLNEFARMFSTAVPQSPYPRSCEPSATVPVETHLVDDIIPQHQRRMYSPPFWCVWF